MASNPMQRKVRNAFILGIVTMVIIAMLIGIIVYVLVIQPNQKKKEEEESSIQYAEVYRLTSTSTVRSGEEVLPSMLEPVQIPIETTITDFVTSPVAGRKSKIDLEPGTILTYGMLYEEEEEFDETERYVEYCGITIPINSMIGDVVDIRFRLPNALDLSVVSRTKVETIAGNVLGFNLNEEEIVLLNSAMVESYLMPGAEIYLATYTEPGLQTKGISLTYAPTQEVVDLIRTNPNIVEIARNELANNYMYQGAVRNPINSTISSYDAEERRTNLESNMQQQMQAAREAREKYLSEMESY